MEQNEWGINPKRRKPSAVDIPGWLKSIKNIFARIWSLPKGPYMIIASFAIILVTFLVFIDISFSSNKVHPRVNIAGFSVGGLSKVEAIKALKKQVSLNYNKEILVHFKGRQKSITPSSIGIKIDYDKSVDEAYGFGRSSSLIKNIAGRVIVWFRGFDLDPVYSVKRDKINRFLEKIGKDDHTPAVNAQIIIKNLKAKLIKPKDGFGIDRDKASNKIMIALLSLKQVELEAVKLSADVSVYEAEQALKIAKTMISSPLILKHEKNKWKISKKEIASLFETKVDEDSLVVGLKEDETIDYIDKLTKTLNKKEKDAEFYVEGANVSIIPGINGLIINNKETYKNVLRAVKLENKRVALVSAKIVEPSRTTEKAKAMGVKERISSFTTSYKPGVPRVKNIHLIAKIIDGTMVAPSEKFSFNETVGKRTEERGFVNAPQIVGTELVDAIGGGICQVSTTFFNAILLGGYPIGERSPHSFYISRYPDGRDAAVSYPKPDLTFTNDTKSWILIKTGYTSTGITVSFYSTDYGREVSFKTELLAKAAAPIKRIEDKTLEKGKEKVEDKGHESRKYLVIRTVKQDGKVIRETKIKSTYKPTKRIVRVGIKDKTDNKEEDEDSKKTEQNISENENENENEQPADDQ